MTLSDVVIRRVRCIDGENPIPGTSGWRITQGKIYDVVLDNGSGWLHIIADDGNKGSYLRSRFENVKE